MPPTTCPMCAEAVPEGAARCPSCGELGEQGATGIEERTLPCPACGPHAAQVLSWKRDGQGVLANEARCLGCKRVFSTRNQQLSGVAITILVLAALIVAVGLVGAAAAFVG